MRDSGTNKPPPAFRPGIAFVFLVLFGLFIAYLTLIPFDFSTTPDQVEAKRQRFFELTVAGASRSDILSNVLLFLPWGGLVAVWLAGRGAGFAVTLLVGTASGCALSGLVEALQLYEPLRISSWIDMATNTAGSALGVILGWLAARVLRPGLELALKSQAARYPLAVLTCVTALGILLTALAPFDVSLDVGDLKTSVKSARLLPFSPPGDHLTALAQPWTWAGEALIWTMLGALCMLALREARVTGLRSLALAVVVLMGLSTFIELAQLTIRSRTSDATSVVLAAVGAAAGGFVVLGNARKAPRDWIPAAILLWALAIVLEAWTPPRFGARSRADLSWAMLVPFLVHFRSANNFAMAGVVVQTMRYLPLGALLAVRPGPHSAWGAGAIGFVVGLILESGQFFLEDRTPEISGALSAAVGAWLGFALARHLATVLEAPSRDREPGA